MLKMVVRMVAPRVSCSGSVLPMSFGAPRLVVEECLLHVVPNPSQIVPRRTPKNCCLGTIIKAHFSQVLHFARRYGTHAATRWQQALAQRMRPAVHGRRPRCFLSATYGSRVEAAPPHEAKLLITSSRVSSHTNTHSTQSKEKRTSCNPHSGVETPTTSNNSFTHTHCGRHARREVNQRVRSAWSNTRARCSVHTPYGCSSTDQPQSVSIRMIYYPSL